MSCCQTTSRTRLALIVAGCLLFSLAAVGAETPASAVIPLLTEHGPTTASLPARAAALSAQKNDALRAAQRVRVVQPNLQANTLKQGDTLYLGLFDDVQLWAVIDRVTTDVNGVRGIRGRIQDSEHGTVLLSFKNSRLLATISLPERRQEYVIADFGKTVGHVIQDIDPNLKNVLESGPALVPPLDHLKQPGALRNAKPGAAANTPATIDLMIVYTPAARQWASNEATGIEHVIDQAMQRNQLALDNSQLGMTMRLVHAAEISYTESGDSGTDLDRLTFHAGYDPWGWEGKTRYMDQIHAWRDTHGADLVSLFTKIEDTGGLGWQLDDEDGDPQFAFNVIRVQQAYDTYTVIHEIGHNMGAHHHQSQLYQAGPGLYSYSSGWRWVGQDGNRYCSIMTYESGQYFSDRRDHEEVPYFSSPKISHQGQATGHATNGDNARTLMNTKDVVAAYRTSSAISPPVAPSNLTATATSATQVNLSWIDNSNDETAFKIERRIGTNGNWTLIATPSANATRYTNTGLKVGQTYFYRLRASHAGGHSAYSNEVAVTLQTANKPDFVVTAITLTPANPRPNTLFKATITVKNQGAAAGDAGWLDVWAHQPGATACSAEGVQYQRIGSLASGKVKTVTFTNLQATRTTGQRTFRAVVDSFCQTDETNETNNQATKSYKAQ